MSPESAGSERVEPVLASKPFNSTSRPSRKATLEVPPSTSSRTSAGDEHLASDRMAGDARGVVHRGAEEPLGLLNGVAGVDPDPDADRR